MNSKRVLYYVPALVMGVVLLWAPSTMVAQGDRDPRVLPPESNPFGLTYGEWAARWWQWAFSLPATHHPGFGTTECSAGQSGPVWFLSGAFCGSVGTTVFPCVNNTVSSCQIPAGKALWTGSWGDEDSFIEEPVGTTEATLRSNAKSVVDQCSGTVTVDREPVRLVRICSSGSTCSPAQAPLYTYRLPSPPTTPPSPPTTPYDNVLAAVGEDLYANSINGLMPNGLSSQGVADGYSVLLAPLPVGRHTIESAFSCPGGSSGSNKVNLTVVP